MNVGDEDDGQGVVLVGIFVSPLSAESLEYVVGHVLKFVQMKT